MDGGLSTAANGRSLSNATDDLAHRGHADRALYQPMVHVMLAAGTGMILDRFGRPTFLAAGIESLGGSAWLSFWWLASAAALAAWRLVWGRGNDRVSAWLLLVSVTMAAAGWHHWNWFVYQRQEVARYSGNWPQPACIDAVACESAERVAAPAPTPLRAIPGTERSRLIVQLTGIRDGRSWRTASGLCQLSVEGHVLWIRPGDHLRVFGQLARVAPPLNPGEFDFAAHARADRQLTRVRCSAPECVQRVTAGNPWTPHRILDNVRVDAKRLVRSMVDPRRAGVAAAILLGAREGLPFAATEPYLETGTIHVLVVSGMNVAILTAGLLAMIQLGVLPRRLGLGAIVGTVIGYALLAESQPPVVRAAVLGVLACLAIWTGRRGLAFNSLFAAAIVVVVINPNDLFRAGPQLSFLAVAVLIWLANWTWQLSPTADPLAELAEHSRPWYSRSMALAGKWCGRLLISSAAVWLIALPLVLHTFHIVSPIAVPASLLVWPLVTVAMWSGFLMVVIGAIAPTLGAIGGTVCDWSLAGLEGLVRWAESVPFGHFWLPGPAGWWVIVFYVGVFGILLGGGRHFATRRQIAALAFWVTIGTVPPLVRVATRDGLECSFVAVGHGTCVVLQGPRGETLLYDAGSLGSPEYATQTIASYLWHQGILRIDGIIVSHADTDHYNAIPGLLERFHVGAVYVSPVMFSAIGEVDTAPGTTVLRESLDRAGVPIHEIWAGNRLQLGPELQIEVLHPPRRGAIGNDNVNSVTLAVECAGCRVLLPGDLEGVGLVDLMSELPRDCDILLAPHHGSRHSDPPGFAAWSSPEWVVVSGGGGDDIAPVARTYQQSGANVLPTSKLGAIAFRVRAGSPLSFTAWRDGPRLSPVSHEVPAGN